MIYGIGFLNEIREIHVSNQLSLTPKPRKLISAVGAKHLGMG